ncbi:hypothetical protein D3C77_684350 [compost metagenome]
MVLSKDLFSQQQGYGTFKFFRLRWALLQSVQLRPNGLLYLRQWARLGDIDQGGDLKKRIAP